MFLSIVIPVYNVQNYLQQCIDSVINQKFTDYEILLINDASTDNSLEICENYVQKHPNIKLYNLEKKGVSFARNTGIKNATGNYIWFIDSDDWITDNAFEKLYKSIDNEDIDILGFSNFNYYENTKTFSTEYNAQEILKTNGASFLNQSTFFFTSACTYIYNRFFLEKNQIFFNENNYHEDDYFNLCCFDKAKNAKKITEGLYYYRKRSNSKQTTFSSDNITKRLQSYKQLIELCGSLTSIDETFTTKKILAYKKVSFYLLDSFINLKQVSNSSKMQMIRFVKKEIIGNNFEEISFLSSKKNWLKDKLFNLNLVLYLYFVKLFYSK